MDSSPLNRFQLDPATLKKLLAMMRTVDIYDEKGRVVGYFVPKVDPADFEGLEPEIDDEEIKRRVESKAPRYTTAEILQDLERP